MARSVNTIEQAAELRRRAEELALRHAAPAPAEPESTLPTWAVEMLHELRVHQIELEMQNEELRRSEVRLEEARARYFDLYELAPLGYFTLDEFGVILEANLYAASRLGVSRFALVQQPFSRFIFREDQDSFYLHRRRLSEIGSAEKLGSAHGAPGRYPILGAPGCRCRMGGRRPPVLRVTMGDISMQKLAEDRQRRLEIELQHARAWKAWAL
jgi:PAS domain-containing protein